MFASLTPRYRSPYETPPFALPPFESDPVAAALASPGLGAPLSAPEPFVWGKGGTRLTPEQVLAERDHARAQIDEAGSGAPVGHWLQGLNRSLGAVTGGLEMRRARKAEEANRAESDAVIEALLEGGSDNRTLLAAAANPYISDEARKLVGMEYARLNPKPMAPHYWETNDGSLGMVGPDGKPVVLYKDPTPKVDWIRAENGDGTITLTPMVNGQPAGGGGQASGASAGPPATLPPDFFDDNQEGGAGASRVGSNFLDGL